MRNDLLQNYIKAEFGRELQLVKDCKTRWSSLAAMISRFNLVKQCIFKALIDLRMTSASYSFTEKECNTLTDIELALEPVKLAVSVLCRENATLVTAETTLRFMISKLQSQNSTLSKELVKYLLSRIKERRSSMTSVLLYLENPGKYLEQQSVSTSDEEDTFVFHSKATLRTEIKSLIERLQIDTSLQDQPQSQTGTQTAIIDVDEDDEENVPHLITRREPSPSNLEEELDRSLRTAWVSVSESSPMAVPARASLDQLLKHEMTLFECGGNRGIYLEAAYNCVKTIPPTSVEAERAFSAAGYMCNKIRSNLKDDTLDMLSFLRKYFQNQCKM